LKVFPKLIKFEFNKNNYWIGARIIITIYKKIKQCVIRFDLRIERFTIQSYIQSNFNKP